MAFRFSLATVLRFRESVEKREELALQRLLLEIARARREVEALTTDIAVAHETRNKAMLNALPAFEIQAILNDLNAAAERRKRLIESLDAFERQRLQQMKKYQA